MRRFDDFQRELGIGRNMLTLRLNDLVDEGVFRRVEYQAKPVRYEYRLTEKGRDVYPVLAAMATWGERWLCGPEGTPLVLHHNTCDHDMHAVVVCSECAQPLDVHDVAAKAGPGAPKPSAPKPSAPTPSAPKPSHQNHQHRHPQPDHDRNRTLHADWRDGDPASLTESPYWASASCLIPSTVRVMLA